MPGKTDRASPSRVYGFRIWALRLTNVYGVNRNPSWQLRCD